MENLNYILSGVIFLLIIWNIFLQLLVSKINKKQNSLFQGKKGADLEEIVLENNNKVKDLLKQTSDLYKKTQENQEHSLQSIHKVGLLRFNPFREIGGDQSFSLALLDDDNNGLIISSLYSREGVRIYAKSIQKGQSVKYPLTEEEKQAIKIASIEKNNQTIKRKV
jgi:hypothetical protein